MKELVQQVIKEKLIVIVRGLPNEEILNTVEALRLAGVKFVEVTFSQNSPTCVEDTYRAIRYISENFKELCSLCLRRQVAFRYQPDNAPEDARVIIVADMDNAISRVD